MNIDDAVLQVLEEAKAKAKNQHQLLLTEQEIGTKVKRLIGNRDGLAAALSDLVDQGRITTKTERGSLKTPNFYSNSPKQMTTKYEIVRYRIKSSATTRSNPYIVNVTGGIYIGGDSQTLTINNSFNPDLSGILNKLKTAAINSDEFSEENLAQVVGDIETIQSQLKSPNPKKEIIKAAWEALGGLSTIAGVAGFYQQAHPLINKLLGIV